MELDTTNQLSNQKGFIPVILGIIILLVVVGGAYYLGTKQTQKTPISSL